jgi:hypothetical protein
MPELSDHEIFSLEPPDTSEHMKRIQFLAKALAYGVVNDLFLPNILVSKLGHEIWYYVEGDYDMRLQQYLNEQWSNSQPQISFLKALEYVEFEERGETYRQYCLTPKAFALLEQPITPPNIFISHRQQTSAAFALLLYEKLRQVGAVPFVDKDLKIGDDWQEYLEGLIVRSDHFVLIMGADTWASEAVQMEVQVAKANSIPIYPVCHGGLKELPPILSHIQGHIIEKENSGHYELAVNAVINRLGYLV